MDRRERKLKRENWLERNGKWYYPFKGFFLAGLALLILDKTYECIIAYWTNL